MRRYIVVITLMIGIYTILIEILSRVNIPDIHYLISGGLLLLVAVCDHTLTKKALDVGAEEGNPIVNFIFRKVGFRFGSLFILALLCVFVIFLWSSLPVYAQFSLIIVYSIVPVNNILVVMKRRKKNSNISSI